MLRVEDALKNLYRSDSTDKNLALDFYRSGQNEPFLSIGESGKILGDSMEIEESLSSAENLDFGSCEASQIKVTLINVEDQLEGTEMVVYQTLEGIYPSADLHSAGDLYPSGYTMPLGRYVIQTVERQANRKYRDVTALDLMCRFDVNVVDWYNALPFPLTLRAFRARLCAYIGVTEGVPDYLPNDDMMVNKTVETATLMGRDVLVACEQANGVFGHFDRKGVLQHVALQPNYTLLPAKELYPAQELYPVLPGEMNLQVYNELITEHLCRSSCVVEEHTVQSIDKVQIRQEEGDIGAIYGDGENRLTVEGNFLLFGKTASELNEIASGIYGMVSGRQYIPYSLELKGLPYLEVGDTEVIETEIGDIATYIIKRTLKGIYALKDTHSATGEEVRGTESNINTDIIQLKGRAAILKRNVDEVSAELIDLEKNTAAKFAITAEQISAEVKRAQEAEAAIKLRADEISLSVTDLQKNVNAQIQLLSNQIEMKVSSDELIASINLGLNAAGSVITMNAGHFEFKGQNFFVNLDGSGGAANGNFTWDKDGKISLKGANISGALVTNLSSSSVLSAATMLASRCVINDSFSVDCRADMADIGANTISCSRIYANNLKEECYTFSDLRLKRDIRDISLPDARYILNALRPVEFVFKKDDERSMGVIAQEVMSIMEDRGIDYPLCKLDEDGWYTVAYKNFIPLIVRVLQEQEREIGNLRKRMEACHV